jgi:hypothetical protein
MSVDQPVVEFVEPCAGMACMSGVLQHGRHWMPAASRFGVKVKYAPATLAVMGLRPGQGAKSYLWCEPDPDVAALLLAQSRPDVLTEAAGHIREWLRESEGPAVWNMCREMLNRDEITWGQVDARRIAAWVLRTGWTRGDRGLYVGPGAPEGINPAAGPETVIRRLSPHPWPRLMVCPDGRFAIPTIPGDASPRTYVYIDAPYKDLSPYRFKLDRAEVLDMARTWHAAGAVVGVAEAERLDGDLGSDWCAVELTGARYGQARPHSKGIAEWLTLNRPPAWVPSRQGGLFTANA